MTYEVIAVFFHLILLALQAGIFLRQRRLEKKVNARLDQLQKESKSIPFEVDYFSTGVGDAMRFLKDKCGIESVLRYDEYHKIKGVLFKG